MSTPSEDIHEISKTNTFENQHITEEPASFNPDLTEDASADDLALLKGDAIGDTLYSERFVLNTLLKLGQLNKDLQEEDEVEKNLCTLWDMTLEKDVVKYLLNQDVLELFASIIKTSEDTRLLEILVGILGNMCCVQETRDQLNGKEEVIEILLELSSCIDCLTLEQLMRLITVNFLKTPQGKVSLWYNLILKSDKFVKNICFILNNAANRSLILQTLECLNAILAKFFVVKLSILTEYENTEADGQNKPNFEELFVQPPVIQSTIEALKSFVEGQTEEQDSYVEIPESSYKAKQTFCNIHSILTQFEELSREAYKSSNYCILKCFKEILQPIAEDNRINSRQQYVQDILETVNDVLKVLPQPFDMDIFKYLLKLLCDTDEKQEKQLNTHDFVSDDGDEIDHQISYWLILNSLYYLILNTEKQQLKQCLQLHPKEYSLKLLESFEQPIESEYLKNCYEKLKKVLEE